MTKPRYEISRAGSRQTMHIESFIDSQPSSRHRGLYVCQLYAGEMYVDWHAVHDDFGNLVKVLDGEMYAIQRS